VLRIKVVNKSNHQLPKHETALAAGLDLRADLMESVVLKPLERNLIGTGLYMELPEGFEAQIRPRSGLAFKRGLTALMPILPIDFTKVSAISLVCSDVCAPLIISTNFMMCAGLKK